MTLPALCPQQTALEAQPPPASTQQITEVGLARQERPLQQAVPVALHDAGACEHVLQPPDWQDWLLPQVVLHAPQLFASVCSFTQAPLQKDVPLGQQLPAEQTEPEPQEVPHEPQWLASVWVFTQALPQSWVCAGQPQPVAVQVPPVAQWLPQAPQLVGSAARSTHAPLQNVWPAAQQLALLHTWHRADTSRIGHRRSGEADQSGGARAISKSTARCPELWRERTSNEVARSPGPSSARSRRSQGTLAG